MNKTWLNLKFLVKIIPSSFMSISNQHIWDENNETVQKSSDFHTSLLAYQSSLKMNLIPNYLVDCFMVIWSLILLHSCSKWSLFPESIINGWLLEFIFQLFFIYFIILSIHSHHIHFFCALVSNYFTFHSCPVSFRTGCPSTLYEMFYTNQLIVWLIDKTKL